MVKHTRGGREGLHDGCCLLKNFGWDNCWSTMVAIASSLPVRCCKHVHKDSGRYTMFVCFFTTNSCVRGKTPAAWGMCRLRLRVSWRTSQNFITRGDRPQLRLWPCSLSVYTLAGSEKTLYVKFLSTISLFSEGKRGRSWRVNFFMSCSLATDRPPESHDRQSGVQF